MMKFRNVHFAMKGFSLFILLMMMMVACKSTKETAVIKIYQGKKMVECVSPEDFLAVFTKNNIKKEPLTQESIEEYLDLFVHYKLKVLEAESLGMDTLAAFVNELAGYREQLAKPYLSDQTVTEQLIQEAWERMQYNIRASHILLTLPKDPSPSDTLKVWKKITQAREKISQGGDFVQTVFEYTDDPYARDIAASETSPGRKGNHGDLGYFTVFDMVYPFESAAYTTNLGEVSEVVRSAFGYHLLKVTDRKPAMGSAFIAHVFVEYPKTGLAEDSLKAEKKINEIYQMCLKADQSFEDIAKTHSEDQNTAKNGGVLRWFNTHSLMPEFVEQVYRLDINGISPPVKTMYGWHVVKVLNREKPGSFEQELPNIKQKIARDSRALRSREEAIVKIREQFNYQEYPLNIPLIPQYLDSSIFSGTWVISDTRMEKNKKPLFKIGEETFTVADFGLWVKNHQARTTSGDISFFVNERFREFSDEKVVAHKDKHLEELYPEFRNLMNEYHDGILLFDLMDKKVWSYAIIDSVGLQQFYEKHKEEHQWDTRADASVYLCRTAEVARNARILLMAGFDEAQISDSLNKDNPMNISIKMDKFQPNDHPLVEVLTKVVGEPDHQGDFNALRITEIEPVPAGQPADPGFYFVHYKEFLPPGPKQLVDVRGLMISQYQELLEKRWLQELSDKYRVEIMRPELEKLYP